MFTTEDVVALTRLIYYTLYCSLNGQYRVEGQENVITQAQDFLCIIQKNKIKNTSTTALRSDLSPQRCQKLQNTVCLSLLFLVHGVCLERGFHYF